MSVRLEFRNPYVDLLESFCEPEEPLREIDGLSFVKFYHGRVCGQSKDNMKVFDKIARIEWDEVEKSPKFITPDGKEWAELSVQSEGE